MDVDVPLSVAAKTYGKLIENIWSYGYMPNLGISNEEIHCFTARLLRDPGSAFVEAYKIINRRVDQEFIDYIDVPFFTSQETTDEQRFNYLNKPAGFTKVQAIYGGIMVTYEQRMRYMNCLSCGQVVILAQDFIASKTHRRCSSCDGLVGYIMAGMDDKKICEEITDIRMSPFFIAMLSNFQEMPDTDDYDEILRFQLERITYSKKSRRPWPIAQNSFELHDCKAYDRKDTFLKHTWTCLSLGDYEKITRCHIWLVVKLMRLSAKVAADVHARYEHFHELAQKHERKYDGVSVTEEAVVQYNQAHLDTFLRRMENHHCDVLRKSKFCLKKKAEE